MSHKSSHPAEATGVFLLERRHQQVLPCPKSPGFHCFQPPPDARAARYEQVYIVVRFAGIAANSGSASPFAGSNNPAAPTCNLLNWATSGLCHLHHGVPSSSQS